MYEWVGCGYADALVSKLWSIDVNPCNTAMTLSISTIKLQRS